MSVYPESNLVKRLVCRFGLRLYIDKEPEHGAILIDFPAVLLDPFTQRLEIKRFQRPLSSKLENRMANAQLAFDEKYVGLDAAETLVQGIEERTLVLVIVMSVCMPQRYDWQRSVLAGSCARMIEQNHNREQR